MKRTDWNAYWQPLVAIVYVAFSLVILSLVNTSELLWAVGIGALSASSCIVFTTPFGAIGDTRHLIGGYGIGLVLGAVMHGVLTTVGPVLANHIALYNTRIFWVLAAITIGLCMIAMIRLKALHPPAVGLSIVLVLDLQHYPFIFVLLGLVLLLALLRFVLAPYLRALV